jgi:restriction endonuclease Mrr
MSGLTKDYMKDFNPESVDKFVRTLQNAVKNKELPKTSTDLLEVFIGEAKEIQNKAFPLIAETRKNAREFYEWSKEMRKEIPTTGKTETILNAIRKSGDKDTSRAMLTYMRDKGNVDLTDLSLALASKQWMGSGSRFALTGVGAFGYYFLQNPAMLAGII